MQEKNGIKITSNETSKDSEWVSVCSATISRSIKICKLFLEGQEIETILGELIAVGYIPIFC